MGNRIGSKTQFRAPQSGQQDDDRIGRKLKKEIRREERLGQSQGFASDSYGVSKSGLQQLLRANPYLAQMATRFSQNAPQNGPYMGPTGFQTPPLSSQNLYGAQQTANALNALLGGNSASADQVGFSPLPYQLRQMNPAQLNYLFTRMNQPQPPPSAGFAGPPPTNPPWGDALSTAQQLGSMAMGLAQNVQQQSGRLRDALGTEQDQARQLRDALDFLIQSSPTNSQGASQLRMQLDSLQRRLGNLEGTSQNQSSQISAIAQELAKLTRHAAQQSDASPATKARAETLLSTLGQLLAQAKQTQANSAQQLGRGRQQIKNWQSALENWPSPDAGTPTDEPPSSGTTQGNGTSQAGGTPQTDGSVQAPMEDLTPAQATNDTAPTTLGGDGADLLQAAQDAFDKKDYTTAYQALSGAVAKDPSLLEKNPQLYYYLGISSEFSSNAKDNPKAQGYYEQYLASPNPDPNIKDWVTKELDWLKVATPANKAIQKAKDDFWGENDPYSALSDLKDAIKKYPQILDRYPDTYYYLALYAQGSGDLSDAKKYIGQAKDAMASQDPSSPWAQQMNQAISSLEDQINDPSLSTSIVNKVSSLFGNSPMAHKVATELVNGAVNWWIPHSRIYSYDGMKELYAQKFHKPWGEEGVATRTGKQSQYAQVLDAEVKKAAQDLAEAKPGDKPEAQRKLDRAKQDKAEFLEALKAPEDQGKAPKKAQEVMHSQLQGKVDELNSQLSPLASKTVSGDERKALELQKLQTEPMAEEAGKTLDAMKTWDNEPNWHSYEKGKLFSFGSDKPADADGKAKVMGVDESEYGPGWWGLGTTMAHGQTSVMQVSLGQNKKGADKLDWRGPFASTSRKDPTSAGISLSKGGKGMEKHQISASGGANVGNLEGRTFDMLYAGPTSGVHLGAQERADLVDAQGGINYAGSSIKLGNKTINNLFTAGGNVAASVGEQGDAGLFGSISINGKNFKTVLTDSNVGVGGSVGAFAGAQATGCVSAGVDGVSANAMGQAWFGIGAKAQANASLKNGELNVDLGLGAALGPGAFADIAFTVDFNQIWDEISGIGSESSKLAHAWGKKAGVLGEVAGGTAGLGLGILKLRNSTVGAVGQGIAGIGQAGVSLSKTMVKGAKDFSHQADADFKKGGMGLVKGAGDEVLAGAEALAAGALRVGSEPLKQGGELLAGLNTGVREMDKSVKEAHEDASKEFKKGNYVSGAFTEAAAETHTAWDKFKGVFGAKKDKK